MQGTEGAAREEDTEIEVIPQGTTLAVETNTLGVGITIDPTIVPETTKNIDVYRNRYG